MSKMRVVQVSHPKGPFEIVEREIPEPGSGAVRIKVQACGSGYCDPCRRGEFFSCQIAGQITGVTYDGGYADYMIAPVSALALVPDGLSAEEAGPLMCAGLTTFNALRNSGARPGDLVAVLGLGGLGHLGVKFAAKMGFKTVAIARGIDKGSLAKELGAQHYIDSQAQDPAAELVKLG